MEKLSSVLTPWQVTVHLSTSAPFTEKKIVFMLLTFYLHVSDNPEEDNPSTSLEVDNCLS